MSSAVEQDSKYVVALEVAQADFERFVEAMDIDTDPKGLDDEDKKSLELVRRKIVTAIMEGVLVIDANDNPIYSPKIGNTKPITFYEPDGAALMAMDQKKRGHDIAKTYALLAAMTKEPVVRFSGMKRRDLRVCEAIMALFLA